ncbi:efflux RND transporter permease subunit [Alteromonas sp. 5E99-2]|uniref:efflux RND transporter permease subunit n=1 Tax=Alteromonas sp. 5E99-2 TaxID=2817683 RepID=UPI001A97E306|nr:efflux RND transporter permease subunit [Alteromonas sp. 5E99-2]MBO1254820.1 efflux RND transporter permease subunit [Alteromonas sp. 5E99-2]
MSQFFIDRPIFAWVLAIGSMLAGLLAMGSMAVSRYPTISPPTVSVEATYTGASASAVEESVTQVIEENLTGLDGLRYISSSSNSSGSSSVQLTFEIGTDPDTAQVQVQNKVQQITSTLPTSVQTQGVTVTKSGDEILMVIGLVSSDESVTSADLGDYIASNIKTPLSRVAGVGSVGVLGSQYAMRIWLDPLKLTKYKLTPSDVTTAISSQNTQVSAGQLGALPNVAGQQLNATITAQSRLQTVEQFRNIILVTSTSSGTVRLSDVADVELGSASYDVKSTYLGQPAAGIRIMLSTGANATKTAEAVNAEIEKLSASLPASMRMVTTYDTTPFIEASIESVIETMIEAVILVFLVMFLFLQNWRATLIPTLAVPVVLLGTFAVLSAFGYSINTLTMFGMVLAIGLLVDDAIVVVENVERVMAEEKLSPLEATRKSMQQISGALIGVGLVLSAVFLPMAFFSGTTGVIYRQFSITIVSAMVLSVLVALIFTPALCATILKAVPEHGHSPNKLFDGFNRLVDRVTAKYESGVALMLKRSARFVLLYLLLGAVLVFLFMRLPTSFVPDEDQGVLMVSLQLPAGATQERTDKVIKQVEEHFINTETDAMASTFLVAGFGLSGSGQNVGLGFIRLKDWSEREDMSQSAAAVQGRAMGGLGQVRDAQIFALAPPSIPGLGSTGGFSMELLDPSGQGNEKLTAAANALVIAANQDPSLQGVRISISADTAQYVLDIDNEKAGALSVSVSDINSVLTTAWGGSYVNDFIDRGSVKKVYVQARADARMVPEDLNKWSVRNSDGDMVPFSAFTTSRWTTGSPTLSRFDGDSSIQIQGNAATGVSSGVAMEAMEKLVAETAEGFTVAWSGLSYEEREAGSNATSLYIFSLLVVFLCLAALYESWSIPLSVLLVLPIGVLGTVIATQLRGLENDVYFQVGLLTILGLTAKNAILIVEFAKAAVDEGQEVVAATLHACRQRLRPIVMTSMAFGLGVLPLVISSGAGSGSQHAVGTGVIGGVVSGTVLGIFMIPLFYVLVYKLFNRTPTGATTNNTNQQQEGL